MLRPVPVADIKLVLEKMTAKVQTVLCETEIFEKKKHGNKVSQISIAYCQAILAAGRLVLYIKLIKTLSLSKYSVLLNFQKFFQKKKKNFQKHTN